MSGVFETRFDREGEISSIIETLGGSGATQIFAHGITSIENRAYFAAMSPGLKRYAERALLIARRDDVVCVVDNVDRDYIRFLHDLGIGPENENIVAVSEGSRPDAQLSLPVSLMNNYRAIERVCGLIKPGKKIMLNPFIASRREFELAVTLQRALGRQVHVLGGNPDIVDFANCKHNVRAKALELGVPVSEGEVVELKIGENGRPTDLDPLEEAISRYMRREGRAIVRGSHSASGSATIVVEDNPGSIHNALKKVAEQTDNRFYLVEVMLDVITSPNVLMYIKPDDGVISCVNATDQRLNNDLAHDGNVYPSSARTLESMIASARRLAEWLWAEGYTGLAGFDFGEYVDSETGGHAHFLAEVNARTNGAAYPKSLMEHLNKNQDQTGGPYIEAFLSANVKTKLSSFAELSESYGHLFFKPEAGKGLVPYNTGCLEYGKFSLAVFGSSKNEVVEMYEEFKALLARQEDVLKLIRSR